MPFGISCAPEVFQQKMHELVEGIAGVKVVADNFAVIGCGSKMAAAVKDHEKNLVRFLECCDQRNVKLNTEKLLMRVVWA